MNLKEELKSQKFFYALTLHLPEEVYYQVADKLSEWIEQKLKEARQQGINECIKITEEHTEAEYLVQNKWAQTAMKSKNLACPVL